jgi:beta-1,4-mannosyl-glycoprotein beta-1,4-N-acetylglucosaminyltransferase
LDRKVYDCFLYMGEINLLRIRLAYLSEKVDYFVICEQAYTFQNDFRTFDHMVRDEIIAIYGERVRWHLDTESVLEATPWQRESRARNLLAKGLFDCDSTDIVLVSDLDEIPNTEIFTQIRQVNLPAVCKQELRVFDPHYKSSIEWMGTVITNFEPTRASIQELRELGTFWWKNESLTILENAGWHLTSMGSAKELKVKLLSFSHTELRTRLFLSNSYLALLVRLGIAIQGNEVYRLDLDIPVHLQPICRKRHHLDSLRIFLGRMYRPIAGRVFKSQVGTLKIK